MIFISAFFFSVCTCTSQNCLLISVALKLAFTMKINEITSLALHSCSLGLEHLWYCYWVHRYNSSNVTVLQLLIRDCYTILYFNHFRVFSNNLGGDHFSFVEMGFGGFFRTAPSFQNKKYRIWPNNSISVNFIEFHESIECCK